MKALFSKMTSHLLILIVYLALLSNIKTEINVHVIPHSHDDLGWIMTVQEYYDQRVKNILDNIIPNLEDNNERTFIYVEVAFFKMWYPNQSEETKNTLKKYLNEGRFEFIMGGYVMHDESSSFYQHFIDQMRIGLQFLKEEFNYRPTIAWFIDPFGHSASNAFVLKQLGFEKIVFVRIDYKEKEIRRENSSLEFNWKPYKDLGLFSKSQNNLNNNELFNNEAIHKDNNNDDIELYETEIFTHITYDHYAPFAGFEDIDQEVELNWNEETIIKKAEQFVEGVKRQNKGYLHNHLLFWLGNDFTYQKPFANYRNMEILIKAINSNSKYGVKLLYSTPTKYFKAIEEEMSKNGKKFPKYENNDFFPYADNAYSYWTGYFTSRPNLKGKVREAGNVLTSASNLLFEKMLQSKFNKTKIDKINNYLSSIYTLREKLAICQHHDAISGTAKDYVSIDYENMLTDSSIKVKNSVVSDLISDDINRNSGKEDNNSNIAVCIPGFSNDSCENILLNFDTQGFTKIKIYHNDINDRDYVFKILTSDDTIQVYDENKFKEIDSDMICNPTYEIDAKLPCYLIFKFSIQKSKTHSFIHLKKTDTSRRLVFIESKKEKINLSNNIVAEILHSEYKGYTGNECETKKSKLNNDGAYIFSTETLLPRELEYTVTKTSGKIVNIQYSLKFESSYIHIRKYFNKFWFEIESVFNPLENSNGINSILHVKTNIDNLIYFENKNKSEPEIWTDANGLKMMRRIKDFRRDWNYVVTEPVTSNFYPTNFCVSIRERNNIAYNNYDYNFGFYDNILSIYNERPQSSGVMKKGEIMILINRNSLKDDSRGVEEKLFESSSNNHYFKVFNYISAYDFDEKNLYNYIHKKPILTNIDAKEKDDRDLNGTNTIRDSIFDKIIYNDNCIQNIHVIDEYKILIQFFNRNDPYFTNKMTNCNVKFNELGGLQYSVIEIAKHGIDINLKDNFFDNKTELLFLKQFEYKNNLLLGESVIIEPQNFKLFLISLN